MLSDAQTYVRCQAVFDPQSFDRKLQPAAEFLKEFVEEHNTLPTEQIVNSACPGTKLEIPKGLNEQALKEMSKKGVYKSVVNTLNTIYKRLNK